MKVLHFDCYAGISGDMALGAFVDLGVDPGELVAGLKTLDLSAGSAQAPGAVLGGYRKPGGSAEAPDTEFAWRP
jgi:hypothetical protein